MVPPPLKTMNLLLIPVLGFFPGILPGKIQEDSTKIRENPGRFQEDQGNSRKIREIPGRSGKFQEDQGNSRKKIFLNNFRNI